MKKRMILIAALASVAAILAAGSLAYFTAEETAFNVITTGVLSIDLVELAEMDNENAPFPEDGVSNVMPGQEIVKQVYVVNDGGADAYVRIKVGMKIRPETLPLEGITLNVNTADWTEQDGWYYYNKPLAPGEKTADLFNTVSFSTALGNEYMNATVEIDVLSQAVQAKNNGESALEAMGWPAENSMVLE